MLDSIATNDLLMILRQRYIVEQDLTNFFDSL